MAAPRREPQSRVASEGKTGELGDGTQTLRSLKTWIKNCVKQWGILLVFLDQFNPDDHVGG